MSRLFNFLSYGAVVLLAVWSASAIQNIATNFQFQKQAKLLSEEELERADVYFTHPKEVAASIGHAISDASTKKMEMEKAIAEQKYDDKLYLPDQMMKEAGEEYCFVIKGKNGVDIDLNLKKSVAVDGLTLSSELYALLGDDVVGNEMAYIYVDQDNPQTLYYSEMIILDLDADEEIYPKSLFWTKVDYNAAKITRYGLVYDTESEHYKIQVESSTNMEDLPAPAMENYSDAWHEACPDEQMNAKAFLILNGHRMAQLNTPIINAPTFMPA